METPLHALEEKVTRPAERVERRTGGRNHRLSVLPTTRRGVMTSTAAALTLAGTFIWPAPAVVFPLALPALSLGLGLSRTAALGRPVGAFEVQS